MSELIVLSFQGENGALQASDAIQGLQKQSLIDLEDAATVIRRQNGKTKVKQAVSLVGEGALGGAFWGMLIGLLFWMPWIGLAIGAATGALAGKFADIGIDDNFIKAVSESVQPGDSALFLLVRNWSEDQVVETLRPLEPTVLRTNLSNDQETRLKEALGHVE
ncbi:MAG: DUF1269 domain-containing protein [Caldilineaceae bacterium]|nr:DUF1269 domain-containing protein [Caldilineaceae bacterium]